MPIPDAHFVNGNPIKEPFAEGLEQAVFGMGCFWGVERRFWETPGVYSTAVGYAGGTLAHATYEQVCSGDTGHAEVVLVIFNPQTIPYSELLTIFWENHDPTQGMRQGNDRGSQYRSIILTGSDRYYAEEYHQQYLAKNAGGYCGVGGTGVTCAAGLAGVVNR